MHLSHHANSYTTGIFWVRGKNQVTYLYILDSPLRPVCQKHLCSLGKAHRPGGALSTSSDGAQFLNTPRDRTGCLAEHAPEAENKRRRIRQSTYIISHCLPVVALTPGSLGLALPVRAGNCIHKPAANLCKQGAAASGTSWGK